MYLNESILDDIESVERSSAKTLAQSQKTTVKPQLTHRVELILKRWQSNDHYQEHISEISEALVTLKQKIQSAMESFSFVNGYEVYFIYGDHNRTYDETLEYNGDSVVLEHTEEESRGSFVIDLYFAAPNFKYSYIDRFVKTLLSLKTNVPEYQVDNLRVKQMRGTSPISNPNVLIESDIFSEYLEKRLYTHFLIRMKRFAQELIPLGDWYKYVKKKDLLDEQYYSLLSNCSKGDDGTRLARLGMSSFLVTDDIRRYKYLSVWAKNIAYIDGSLLINGDTFHKAKSDNKDAKKEDFQKAIDTYLKHVAQSYELFEGSGSHSYMLYIVFNEPFIFMDVEYVLIIGGVNYSFGSDEDVIKIARILMMLVLSGETPERTVDRFLSKRKDAYSKTLRHDILEVLNYNAKKMKAGH